ncbi:MAG: SH3 domain-containing protein [Alphaproteobacteria bacterium]|nr:SH3 domain-containing protein [Alphaproteobacteria bacterium]
MIRHSRVGAAGFSLMAIGAAIGGEAIAQDAFGAAPPDVPECQRNLGVVRVVDRDEGETARPYDLPSPDGFMTAVVRRSGCFSLSDLNAESAAPADYVLVTALETGEARRGNPVLGAVGNIISGRWGRLTRSARERREGLLAILSLVRVGTAEKVTETRGRAIDQESTWIAGGTYGLGEVARAWEESEMGRVASSALIDAYAQMMAELGGLDTPPQAAAGGMLRAPRAVNMRAGPTTSDDILRTLPAGALVRATSETDGRWRLVVDENDVQGWVRGDLLDPAPGPAPEPTPAPP